MDYLLLPRVVSLSPGLLYVCNLRRARGILDGLAGNDDDGVDIGWELLGGERLGVGDGGVGG